ncbi:probable methyltransferase At1g29790 [Miscanthus floridulus]|uniref:probable methyltransferase At1g29790 n=1 Tax=Miscanthus floridulus TaxID=154761 RepID=UPI00345AABEC
MASAKITTTNWCRPGDRLSPRKAKINPHNCYSGTTTATLLMFLLTNVVSVAVVSSGVGPSLLHRYSSSGYRPAATIVHLWDGSAALQADLNATQAALATGHADLADLHPRVRTANELLQAMQDHGGRDLHATPNRGWKREPADKLRLAIGPHCKVAGAATGEVFLVLGHACVRVQDDLERYMDYMSGGDCPSDEPLAHRLMLSGCEPMPHRRCHPRSPKGYPQPLPLPWSLWTMPPDTIVVWNAYVCKNYSCLAAVTRGGGISGCDDGCFDLRRGRGNKNKANRWAHDDSALSYSIDAVLRARPNGTVRIGLYLGGGSPSGTLVERMLERARVTVLTVAINSGAPFSSFVASRGLVLLHVTTAHRLPLFDGTMDIVHVGNDLGGGGWVAPGVMLEFALFDVYRVLRPGGLFWLDHFVCVAAQLNATFALMIHRVRFRKLQWNTSRGKEKEKWYVSALLEKPMT